MSAPQPTTTHTPKPQGPTIQRLYADICNSTPQITIHPVTANVHQRNFATKLITQMIPHYMERYHMTPRSARAAAEREVARQYPANKWDAPDGPNAVLASSPGETDEAKRAEQDDVFTKYLAKRGKQVINSPVTDHSSSPTAPVQLGPSSLSEGPTRSAAPSPSETTPANLLDGDDEIASWTPLTPSLPSASTGQSEPAESDLLRSRFDDWSEEMGEEEEEDEDGLEWCRFPVARMELFGQEELKLEWCRIPAARVDMPGEVWW